MQPCFEADAADRVQRLASLAVMARDASGRLNDMAPERQREVLTLLGGQASVIVAADRSRPSILTDGTVDSRLFDASSQGTAVGGPPPPAS